MTIVAHPPYFSVSPIEDKTEMLPLWHDCGDQGRIAATAEQPQNMTSRMYIKNYWSAGNGVYARKGTTSRVTVTSRPKVSKTVFSEKIINIIQHHFLQKLHTSVTNVNTLPKISNLSLLFIF
jgi:hypothetical protein